MSLGCVLFLYSCVKCPYLVSFSKSSLCLLPLGLFGCLRVQAVFCGLVFSLFPILLMLSSALACLGMCCCSWFLGLGSGNYFHFPSGSFWLSFHGFNYVIFNQLGSRFAISKCGLRHADTIWLLVFYSSFIARALRWTRSVLR